ncbi:MAG: hypothetical protein AB8H80_06520 [Planctomycetota bacterium]
MRRNAVYLLPLAVSLQAARAQSEQPTSTVDLLLADEWPIRQAAAKKLWSAKTVSVGELLKVLESDWSWGQGAAFDGRGGEWFALDGTPLVDIEPFDSVRLAAYQRMLFNVSTAPSPKSFAHDSVADLDLAVHPHELAAMLLRRHHSSIEKRETRFAPTSLAKASAWLQLNQPSAATIGQTCLLPELETFVIEAMWCLGGRFREQLHELLQDDNADVRAMPIRARHGDLLSRPAGLARVIDQLLDAKSKQRHEAAALLLDDNHRGAVAAALAARLPTVRSRTRRGHILATLALIGKDATSVFPILCDSFADARWNRRFALCATRQLVLDTEQRQQLLTRTLPLLESTDDTTRALVLDIAAANGDLLEAERITFLQQMLNDPARAEIAPRVLGCLHRIGAVPKDMPTADKAALVDTEHANLDTWLAVLADGRKGGEALLRAFQVETLVDLRIPALSAMGAAMPDLMREWLQHDDARIRRAALASMKATDNPTVPTPELVALAADKELSPDAVVSCLLRRKNATPFASQIAEDLLALDANEALATFVEGTDLPAALKTTVFESALARGIGWPALHSLSHQEQLREWRRLWDPRGDETVRRAMAKALCAIGPSSDADVDLLISYLNTDTAVDTLSALLLCAHVTQKLHDALTRSLDDYARDSAEYSLIQFVLELKVHDDQ